MKHTYLFKATDPEMSRHRLQKLINVLRRTTTVSWKYEGNSDEITMVQCFVDGPSIYQLVSRAGIHGDVWDQIIRQARENGEPAVVQQAREFSEKMLEETPDQIGLDEIRAAAVKEYAKKDAIMSLIAPLIQNLQGMGCAIKLTQFVNGDFFVAVFNDGFRFGPNALVGFLRGLEAGFISAPQWKTESTLGSTKPTRRSKRSA